MINTRPGRLSRLFRKLAWYLTVYFPAKHDVTITTRNGVLTFNSKDKTTGRYLYIYRNHEFDDMMRFVAMLRKEGYIQAECEGAVLDIGGYIGMSSAAFLLEDIFEKAVAFEPSPENYRLLTCNIKNNDLQERMIAHNIALSDSDSTLEFELSPKNYGDHRIRKSGQVEQGFFGEQGRKVIKVQAKTLNSISENELGVSKSSIRLIWMDIQGHEGKFLRGARDFLKNHPQVPVVMEFWPYAIKRSGMSRDEFVSLVNDLFEGYFVINNMNHEYYNINMIGDFFDQEDDPQKGSTVVLVNRKPTSSG